MQLPIWCDLAQKAKRDLTKSRTSAANVIFVGAVEACAWPEAAFAAWRIIGQHSNRRWMKLQWQVKIHGKFMTAAARRIFAVQSGDS